MNKLYRFLQIFLRPFYRIFFGMRVIGRENELSSGPCIICANHISMHDIILIALNLKRQIFFFAKKELFKNPLFAKILRSFGTISVSPRDSGHPRDHTDHRRSESRRIHRAFSAGDADAPEGSPLPRTPRAASD